jgi:cytoskeletal protein RodZ
MTIEGLGKKFQEARVARKLTLDEAARMTKIRPSRLAELEADDFSQFPSLAYAKGFLLIYGKFLEVDVTPYLEAFEGSENVTVDGYSYLQESPAPKPKRTPIIRAAKKQASVWPLLVAVAVFVVGFSVMKLVMNLKRLEPNRDTLVGIPQPSAPSPSVAPSAPAVAVVPSPQPAATKNSRKIESPAAPPIVAGSPANAGEPEVRRAQPVPTNEVPKTGVAEKAPPAESSGENRVDIKPLRKTYLKVVVDNEATTPAFEHWVSPGDGPVEFHGQHIAVRVLDREAIQIKKNGKLLAVDDTDITIQ